MIGCGGREVTSLELSTKLLAFPFQGPLGALHDVCCDQHTGVFLWGLRGSIHYIFLYLGVALRLYYQSAHATKASGV